MADPNLDSVEPVTLYEAPVEALADEREARIQGLMAQLGEAVVAEKRLKLRKRFEKGTLTYAEFQRIHPTDRRTYVKLHGARPLMTEEVVALANAKSLKKRKRKISRDSRKRNR